MGIRGRYSDMAREAIRSCDSDSLTRIAKWATTGVLTVALDVLLFRMLYPVTQSVLIANAISVPATTLFNYILHHKWSFESQERHGVATSRYLATMLLGYVLNSLLVKAALLAGADATTAKLLAVPIQAPINYVALRYWVFRGRPTQ